MNWHIVFRDYHKARSSFRPPWWGLFGTRGIAYPASDQREYFDQVFARIYRVTRHYTCSTTGGDQEEVPRHLWQNAKLSSGQ